MLTSLHPFISRNILATGIIPLLLKRVPDLEVVILVPDYKTDYFRQKFVRDRVWIEGVRISGASSLSTLFFKRLARAMLDTSSTRIQKRSKLEIEGGYLYFLVSWLVAILGKSYAFRSLARYLDYRFADTRRFQTAVGRHHPSLIVATDIQNEHNVAFLQFAKRFKITAIAMVRSWDNLTSLQGVMRIIPDFLMVPTEFVKQEAISYNDMPREKIAVVGIPHYDRYLTAPKMERSAFLISLGLNPAKKLILYTTLGDRYIGTAPVDQCVLEILKKFDVNVIVRCHPGDTITLRRDFEIPPNMIIDRPGVVFREREYGDREISEEDDNRLMNELYHSDVVVLCASTIAIDAALFNKPSVGVAFSEQQASYWQSPARFYDYHHMRRVVESGGMRIARTRVELQAHVRAYLENVGLDHKGRRRLIQEQYGMGEAGASELIAECIINHLL